MASRETELDREVSRLNRRIDQLGRHTIPDFTNSGSISDCAMPRKTNVSFGTSHLKRSELYGQFGAFSAMMMSSSAHSSTRWDWLHADPPT